MPPATTLESVRLAVDIGGTFTDVVLETPKARFSTKVLTTKTAPEEGVLDGILKALKLRDAFVNAACPTAGKFGPVLTLGNPALRELRRRGVACTVHWRPLHLHPYYREQFGWTPELLPAASREWARRWNGKPRLARASPTVAAWEEVR